MKHSSNFVLELEVLPGTSIADAVEEAKNLAIRLDIAYVTFKFNDVRFSVGRKAIVENDAGDALNDCFENKKKFCILN